MSDSDLPPNLWRGRLIRLRAVEPEDWEAFQAIDQDTERQRMDSDVKFPSSAAASKEWAQERAKRTEDDTTFLSVERLQDRVLVGSVGVWKADRRHRVFSYGLGLGRPYWRQGYGREAVLLTLRYYFLELGYEKAEAGVYEFNAASLAFHAALGFVQEGVRRSAVLSGGRRWDEVLFGMTAAEFRERYPGLVEEIRAGMS